MKRDYSTSGSYDYHGRANFDYIFSDLNRRLSNLYKNMKTILACLLLSTALTQANNLV